MFSGTLVEDYGKKPFNSAGVECNRGAKQSSRLRGLPLSQIHGCSTALPLMHRLNNRAFAGGQPMEASTSPSDNSQTLFPNYFIRDLDFRTVLPTLWRRY